MKRLIAAAAPVLLIALLLAVWELACRSSGVPSYVLPAPSQIAAAAASDAPTLLASAWTTLAMALTALAVVSVLGTGLALILAASPLLERAVKPIAIGFQVTPIVAIAG